MGQISEKNFAPKASSPMFQNRGTSPTSPRYFKKKNNSTNE